MLMPENVQLIKLTVLTNLSLLDAYYDCAHTSPMQKNMTKVAATLSSVRLSTAIAFFTQGTVDSSLISLSSVSALSKGSTSAVQSFMCSQDNICACLGLLLSSSS